MVDAPFSARRRSDKYSAEQALEQAFVAHEAWAFEAAYTTYRQTLYGAAYGVLQQAAEAQDCVHDVLFRLWQRGHAYTAARGSLRAFLCVCVRNEALSRRRRARNRARIEQELPVAVAEAPQDDRVLDRIEVAESMQALSAAQRDAIRLAYFEGMTHEQIAVRLGEPVGTVKSRLSNALRTLRTVLVRPDTT